jgi:AcrR family transcriptional regulator
MLLSLSTGKAPGPGGQTVFIDAECIICAIPYTREVPKLWSKTIEAHRRGVHDAILDTTAELVSERGLLSVTMSEIAERAGIGRATLYKYFPDVEAILLAWHERGITVHLEQLRQVRKQDGSPRARLEAVLEAYALIDHEHHGSEQHRGHLEDRALTALLHRGGHVARAHQELVGMFRELITEAAQVGDVRDDVPPRELASYCMHSLEAASSLPTRAAVRRLVAVTLDGLRPPI